MTLTVFDPETGKRVVIAVPDTSRSGSPSRDQKKGMVAVEQRRATVFRFKPRLRVIQGGSTEGSP
jgi:hypothetical protein